MPAAEDTWKPSDAERAERLFLAESCLARTMAATFQGALGVGFALALGADAFVIGLLGAASFIGGFGQLVTNPLIQLSDNGFSAIDHRLRLNACACVTG